MLPPNAGHNVVELWQKRKFRCDCPTNAILVPCVLHPCTEDQNTDNAYSQNFRGVVCRCRKPYVAEEETETLMQCAACEVRFRARIVALILTENNQDWFHESCLHLRDKRPTQPVPYPDPTLLIPPSTYEALICGACVRKSPLFMRWAGSSIMRTIVWRQESSKTKDGKWTVVGGQSNDDSEEWCIVDRPLQKSSNRRSLVKQAISWSNFGMERLGPPEELSSGCYDTEDQRWTSPSRSLPVSQAPSDQNFHQVCCAPMPPAALIRLLTLPGSSEHSLIQNDELHCGDGEGDLFLSPGWAEYLCRCVEV